MQEISEYTTPDGWNTADVGISKKEWIDLLNNEDVLKQEYKTWLLRFYKEPKHQSSCYLLGKKYNTDSLSINAFMTNFGRAIQKHLNRFKVASDDEDGKQHSHFLTIFMMGKPGGKTGYQLMLKEEVCAALHDYLIQALLREFAERVVPIGLTKEKGIDELYKWELVTDCSGKDDEQVLRRLIGTNLIDNRFDGAALKKLLDSEPEDVVRCFAILKREPDGLQGRYDNFREELDALVGDRWQYKISDERMASSFLACAAPSKYTFYKVDAYTALCEYLRIEPASRKKKMCHFFTLLQDLQNYLEEDKELTDFFAKETAAYIQSPLLNVQTIVWYMKDYMTQHLAQETTYTWVPFVKEFAQKLLSFRNRRDELITLFYGINRELIRAYQEGGEDITDLTPFTVLGTLAVGKTERRSQFASYYKEKLGIQANIPSDYTGFPSLHPQRVMFIFGKDKAQHTEPFWDLFEAAMEGNEIAEAFDKVMSVKGTNRNVSMGLFWIAPTQFLSFDSTNEAYLIKYGFPRIPGKDKINYAFYKKLMDDVQSKMETGVIKEKDFLEFSTAAYAFGKDNEIENEDMERNYFDEITTALKDKKSIILQGAPGTGKTYAIPEIVARLCGENIDLSDRTQVMNSFSRLVAEKRVVFTTFHQSMDYEDFVEGLKPFVDENKNVYYDVVDGIFKTICKDAAKPIIRNNSIDLSPDATFWKVSLQGTYDNEVRTECLKNGHIRIGWDDYGENYEEQTFEQGGRIVLDAFYNKMTEGDIVLSCYTNKLIDAIGVVEGEPEWHDEYKFYKRLRKVRWLVKGIREDISVIMGKNMTLSTVYKISDITVDNILEILKKHSAAGSATSEKNTKPYVIVIDEINRGNVSKIFGELITLLEADKRTDGAMPLTVRLPYSKTDLGIPSNLYLIGTMNTADRSLSQFDYAMRRRFRFITMAYGLVDMKPAPGMVFQDELFAKVSKLFISNYDEYLEDVNTRLVPADCFSLEFKPVDLWIGPSYFITDESDSESLYNNIFYEIIPTLEQYLEDGVFVDEAPVNAVIEDLKEIALNA